MHRWRSRHYKGVASAVTEMRNDRSAITVDWGRRRSIMGLVHWHLSAGVRILMSRIPTWSHVAFSLSYTDMLVLVLKIWDWLWIFKT